MGMQYEAIPSKSQDFIRNQKIFFVGTAGKDGRVNVSPKGMDSFRIIDKHTVRWLNVTGSGNETAAHVLENQRMTIMFCAFEGNPLILRLYGNARIVHPSDKQWTEWAADFPPLPGARQIFELHVDLVQTSCGFGVPYFDFRQERQQLNQWAENKDQEKIQEYWSEKNAVSIDGKPTDMSDIK